MNISNKYKAFPFWSWNDELDEKELVRQIDWMHDNGIGGFFMHARGGLTTPYLGDKWFSCVEACLKRAKELDMEAYAYDENGWPSGFVGGKLLEKEENHDMYLLATTGEFDPKAQYHYDISTSKIKRVESGDNVLNIFLMNSTSTADVCNKEVVRKFIDLTHEEYKKHDIYGNLRGFFTDEPQYFRWHTPYTRVLPKYFLDTYGEDLFDRLGLLFVELDGYKDFRYKYYKAMQSLMLDAFAKQIYDWCDENGYKLTGHYCEESRLSAQMWCCGGVMPFYEYEHIPGVDFLGRPVNRAPIAKQLGSVCSQLGKEQRMTECFACAGWDATPNELKLIAEHLMVDGVNIICHHLLPYSEHGQRKRDYPEHYSNINPWVNKAFGTFNDYFTELGYKLAKSKEIVNVGMFQPIRTAYFYYKREDIDSPKGVKMRELDQQFNDSVKLIEDEHIPFHLIDETILSKYGSVDNKSLVCGLCKYDYIVIPNGMETMDKTTEALLKKYVSNGGKVLIMGEKPTHLEGDEYNYSYLESNTNIEEIKNNQFFKMNKTTDVISNSFEDENGQKYIYVLNLGDDTDVEITVQGYKSLLINGKIFGNKIHFDKYESKIIYLSNEEPKAIENCKQLVLKNEYKVTKPVDNFIIIDNVQYSMDDKEYSLLMNYMGAFNNLLKSRYHGDLYLKYKVNVKKLPKTCFALIEDTRLKEVKVNGIPVNKCGTVLEKDLWKFDVTKALKTGENEIVCKIDFFEQEIVYYALFGENVTESIKNCLAYDTTIEAIYLMGDFGVYGDLEKHEKTYVGNNFYIAEQKDEVKTLIEDGFIFFRGNISLEQEINLDSTNYELVFPNRFQVIDIYVNDVYVDRLMFGNKCNFSKYLKIGKNKIRLDVVISNRNLLGPHHLPEEESLGVGPFSWELVNSWDENGKSPLCLDRYSFVKVI